MESKTAGNGIGNVEMAQRVGTRWPQARWRGHGSSCREEERKCPRGCRTVSFLVIMRALASTLTKCLQLEIGDGGQWPNFLEKWTGSSSRLRVGVGKHMAVCASVTFHFCPQSWTEYTQTRVVHMSV